MKSKKFTILLLFIAIVLVTAWYISDRMTREYGAVSNIKQKEALFSALSDVWTFAGIEGDKVCKNLENTDDFFYQCNPMYFSCLLEKNILNNIYKKVNLNISIDPKYDLNYGSNGKTYLFQAKINDVNQTLSFKDSCREVYLPKRFYPFLVEQRLHTFEWDNHSRNIFVDKYLVRAFEIVEYAKHVKDSELLAQFEKSLPSEVVTNISVEKMKSFCRYQAKELLSAEVFDAASIFPEDESDDHSRLLRAPYYPWVRKNTDSILYDIQENDKKISESDLEKLCRKNYSKDCLKHSFINYDRENVSWMGMYEIFGGYFEYLNNTIYPLENIKISSRYLPFKNKYHRTGMRGYWDMENYGVNNILIKGEENIENYKIAFRCMRFVK